MTSKKIIQLVPNLVFVGIVNKNEPDPTKEQQAEFMAKMTQVMRTGHIMIGEVAEFSETHISLQSHNLDAATITALAEVLPNSHLVTYRIPVRTDYFKRTVLEWGYESKFELTHPDDLRKFNQLIS